MPATSLTDTTWLLAEGIEVPAGVTVTAELSGGIIAGSSGCNTYRAAYELDGERLRLSGPVASTLMMCSEPQMAVEAEVLQRLARISAYRLGEGRLALLDVAGDVLLAFRPIGPADLLGSWRIVNVHIPERQAVVSVDGNLELTFAERSVHGHSGCNRFSGAWSAADGRTMRIGPLATTRMHCPEPVMAQERALLHALESVTAWRATGDLLHLLREGEVIAVSLVRSPAA